MISELESVLQRHKANFHPVVKFEPGKDHLLPLDFTEQNADLRQINLSDTGQFSAYVSKQLKDAHATYGIGGYKENRVLYKRSNLFDTVAAEGRPAPLPGVAEPP